MKMKNVALKLFAILNLGKPARHACNSVEEYQKVS